MKTFQILFILTLFIISCNRNEKKVENSAHNIDIQQGNASKDEKNKQSLVLTDDALQLVDLVSGNIYELPFGTQLNQMTEIINNIVESNAISDVINTECGAGPLKMVAWSNGLTIVFQENNTKEAAKNADWLFQGWFIDVTKEGANKLTTMAGIGIGTSLEDLHNAYEIEVKKTSLGQEFSTASGLYGILDGIGNDAKITHLWSGVSCNFR